MGRNERRESPTGYYHVTQRGAGKQILFEDEADHRRYLEKLVECRENTEVGLVAYCLMNNHVHLLLYAEEKEALAKVMMRLGTSYAKYYNVKYDHPGYVFQGRFHSEPIQDESYLLSCVRYIHNNPLKAGLADRDKYRWSSYNEYVGVNSIVDNKIVMEMFENRGHFEAFSAAYDERIFYDIDDNVVTCSVGKDIIRKHYGTEFENTLIVKQLRCEERNSIIREMKAAGLSNHQIELITGVSRSIVAKIK